jgi:hypothetical protein
VSRASEPVNVFRSNLIRPRDLENCTSIKVSTNDSVTIDGCENIEHLVIEPEKVAQRLNVLGPFPEHLTIDGRFKRLKLGGSMHIRDWEPFVGNWSRGLICNHLKPIDNTPDIMVMAFPQSNNGVLRIGPEYCGKTLAIRGTSTVRRIIIEPEKQMNHIVIQSMEWLEEVVLKGRVTQLDISNTPNLQRLTGYGHYLKVKTNSYVHTPPLSISGFWLNLETRLGREGRATFVLNESDLKTCDDLQGRVVYTPDYNIACKWSEILDIDIEEAVLGISLGDLISLWKESESKAKEIFDGWLDDERFHIDKKYFGMRIAMALLLDGRKKRAIRARNIALTSLASNRLLPLKLQPLVQSRRDFFSQSRRDTDCCFAPYDILDLEFLCRSFMDEEMPPVLGNLSDCMTGTKFPLEWLTLIDANRELDFGAAILDVCSELIEKLKSSNNLQRFQYSYMQNDYASIIYCLEKLELKGKNKNMIIEMADIIEESHIPEMVKAGLYIALMQKDDRPELRLYLARLSSSIDRETYRLIHSFRISGIVALRNLGIKRLEYPYELRALRR